MVKTTLLHFEHVMDGVSDKEKDRWASFTKKDKIYEHRALEIQSFTNANAKNWVLLSYLHSDFNARWLKSDLWYLQTSLYWNWKWLQNTRDEK